MKYEFIKENADNFSIERMCHMFSIERSGYYAWLQRKPGKREIANQSLDGKVVSLFKKHHGRYGAKRLTDDLHDLGEKCGKNRVAKRMLHLGLKAKAKKKFKVTTDSKHNLPIAPNVLNRDFIATAPNQKWVADISYLWTDEGWMYLAVVIDLYSRAVIGWSIQPTMTKQLICDAFIMALWRRGFPKNVLFHSDRGSQYCSYEYQGMLKENGFISSMSRKGNCWDNAVAESFFHTLKVELIHAEKYTTRNSLKPKTKCFSIYRSVLQSHPPTFNIKLCCANAV